MDQPTLFESDGEPVASLETRVCDLCGREFARRRKDGRPPRYCSIPCRTKASNARAGNGTPESSWPRSPEIEARVCEEYLSGLSCESLKERYGVNSETIRRVLRRNNITMRHRNASTARKRLKGGRVRGRNGYMWLLLDSDDPLYCMAMTRWGNGAGRYAVEHRVVMARHLGRPLFDFENVHHINGRRDDNRLENLELWVVPQPKGQRPDDLVRWVVGTYPELVRECLRGCGEDPLAFARHEPDGVRPADGPVRAADRIPRP